MPADVVDGVLESRSSKLCYSQPEDRELKDASNVILNIGQVSFSQPTQIDDLLLATQFLPSQSSSTVVIALFYLLISVWCEKQRGLSGKT